MKETYARKIHALREKLHLLPKINIFELYLEIINTFLKNNTYIL